MDFIVVGIGVLFFAFSWAYIEICQKL